MKSGSSSLLLLLLCSLSLVLFVTAQNWRPVVFMHGLGADASNLDLPRAWLAAALPGIYTVSVEIGNGYWDSFFITMSDQVEMFCNIVKADPHLVNGFNLVGYSQGGLITRGYVERCDGPPVYNYITWSGPHGGQFGIPETEWTWVFKDIWEMMYDTEIQDHVSFAQYWRDPFQLQNYLEYSIYLADINNARPTKNETYRDRMKSLNNLVLLMTTADVIVLPPSSGWFQSYAPNNDSDVVPLRQSQLYLEDWLGLKFLDDNGKLHLFSCTCAHTDYPFESCHDVFNKYTLPFLNNTLPG